MNQDFEHLNQNRYDGNGWSKYQLMVLQQLDDHNTVLQNLNKEITDIKQAIAVSDTELKMWRAHAMTDIVNLKEDVDSVLYDEKGIGHRLMNVERMLEVEQQSNNKTKATWALYGSVAIVIINIAIQLISAALRYKY